MDEETSTATEATAAETTAATTAATETTPAATETQVAEKQWWEKIQLVNGEYPDKWQESLPPEADHLKPIAARYKNPIAVLESLKENMTYAREKGNVKPLTDKSTPEEVADYRAKMGIPLDAPYSFEKPEKLPDGLVWNEEMVKTYGKWAHDNNLTPAQAKGALELYNKFIGETHTAMAEAQKAQYDADLARENETLKLMFGGTLDGVVVAAKRAALHLNLPTEAFDPGSPTFLGPVMLGAFERMARMIGEPSLPTAAAVTNLDEMGQADDIIGNPSNPDHQGYLRGDQRVWTRINDLVEKGLARRRQTEPRRGAA